MKRGEGLISCGTKEKSFLILKFFYIYIFKNRNIQILKYAYLYGNTTSFLLI